MKNPTWDDTVPAWEDTDPLDGQQGSDQSPSVMDTVKSSLSRIANQPKEIAQNMTPEKLSGYAPAAGAVMGGGLGTLIPVPGAGTGMGAAVGAGIGQIISRMADIGYGRVQPGEAMNRGKETLAPMAQAALGGITEVGGVKNAIQGMAKGLGRRSLGIMKPMIDRMAGGVDEANRAAQDMLDQGVIKPFSGAKATLARAENVAQVSGKAVGDALSKTGKNALEINSLADEVSRQLTPFTSEGAYGQQKRIVDEIVDTIKAHGKPIDQPMSPFIPESGDIPTDFSSAQRLKNTLKQMAGNNWNTDKLKASMYQRAYGIVSDALENSVQNANPAGIDSYVKNKALYGSSQKAIRGLEDKVNREASNSILSLRGAAIGSGAIASGNVAHALEALGAWEAGRRIGAGTGSSAINYLNNSPLVRSSREALTAEFVKRISDLASARSGLIGKTGERAKQ